MGFKVTFIGAGSVGSTGRLLSDLLTVPAFRDLTVEEMKQNAERHRAEGAKTDHTHQG